MAEMLTFYDMINDKSEPPEAIIGDGVLLDNTILMIIGQKKARKSFFALNLSMAIASGLDFAGFKIEKKSKVLHLSLEGGYFPNRSRIRKMSQAIELDSMKNINFVKKGAHFIINHIKYSATILATGSELEIAYNASKKLSEEGINVRVVSIPSLEIFDTQDKNYKENILGDKPLFAIEAGVINGWERYVPTENFIGMKSFGSSGPYKELYKHFEITEESLTKLIKKKVKVEIWELL